MTLQFRSHFSDSAEIEARAHEVLTYLDNPGRLSTHMTRSSWMMGGGKMNIATDEGAGARVGSRIRLSGKAFGLSLFVDEAVTQYEPQAAKTWETLGDPKLLVIGRYRMGFRVADGAERSKLRVFIDYDLPRSGLAKVLGLLFGHAYASWCVKSMLVDGVAHFRAGRAQPSPSIKNSS